MSKAHPPELKRYLDKKLQVKLNGNRVVSGIMRGFDPFMNIVLDESVQIQNDGISQRIGMVVIRGDSILTIEALDKVDNP